MIDSFTPASPASSTPASSPNLGWDPVLLDQIQVDLRGIHSPLLLALHRVQASPGLTAGVGLGVVPAPGVPWQELQTLEGQIRWAAQSLRVLMVRLITGGWRGPDLWDGARGRYSDRFLGEVAQGFRPGAIEEIAAHLEPCDPQKLQRAYAQAIEEIWQSVPSDPPDQTHLDRQLLHFVDRVPQFYRGLAFQRRALEGALEQWFPLPDSPLDTSLNSLGDGMRDFWDQDDSPDFLSEPRLLARLARVCQEYGGFPPQREALLSLVRCWWQLESREAAILALLQETVPLTDLSILDSALINVVLAIPHRYQRSANQRYALSEAFRLWQNLAEQAEALVQLGVDPLVFTKAEIRSTDFQEAALQVDRGLLAFVRRIPLIYQASDAQRQALIRLVQIWRNLEQQPQAVDSLILDWQRMEQARRGSPDAPLSPPPEPLDDRPDQWTPQALRSPRQLYAPIVPGGTLTWAQATAAGLHLPPTQAVVDSIQRLAPIVQEGIDRLGRPLQILHWYLPNPSPPNRNRHALGDALVGYVEGLTAQQVYWAFDPWWPGGLGHWAAAPLLVYLDARSDRVRWHCSADPRE